MTNKKNEIIIHEENKDAMSLPVIQWKGQRVITLQEIAMVHGVPLNTVQVDFNRNRCKRFVEGEHYFKFEGRKGREALIDANNDSKSLLEHMFGNALRWVRICLTEHGYLRLCKILTDDISWDVQEQLINCYFRMKDMQANGNPFDIAIKGIRRSRRNMMNSRLSRSFSMTISPMPWRMLTRISKKSTRLCRGMISSSSLRR